MPIMRPYSLWSLLVNDNLTALRQKKIVSQAFKLQTFDFQTKKLTNFEKLLGNKQVFAKKHNCNQSQSSSGLLIRGSFFICYVTCTFL